MLEIFLFSTHQKTSIERCRLYSCEAAIASARDTSNFSSSLSIMSLLIMLIKSDSTNDNNDDELRRIQNSNKRITKWMKKGLKSEEKKARLKQIDEPVEAGRTRVKNKRSSFEIAWWASEQTTQHKRKTVGEEEGEKTKILNWKSCLNNLKCFWLQHRQKIEELKVWEASAGRSFRCCWCSP